VQAIGLLVKHGADIEAKSVEPRAIPCGPLGPQRKNRTPLHLAVISQEAGAVEAMVKLGANCNYNDIEGKTPLSHALPQRYLTEGHAEALLKLKKVVKTLIESGADPNKPADCGKSFKELAGEIVEKQIRVEGKWVDLGEAPLSLELLEFVRELENR